MFNFDLQLFGGLFGGGGGGETQVVEKQVVQSSAPAASPVQNVSDTASEKMERRKKFGENVRGRRSTITGAGTTQGVLESAGSIAKTLLGEQQPKRKTIGGA